MKKQENKVDEKNEINEKIMELTNDLQRTRADFENFRKQTELQKENEKKAAELRTVFKMLPMVDDLKRALDTYPELAPLKKTFEKTMNELGLTLIDSTVGAEFNPDVHEAVMATGEGEKEVIAETLRPGYLYNGEVLRAAMVRVERK